MYTSRYVIVTPVRDEEHYIAETIQSVLRQSQKPERWIIVDDGSIDKTPEIIDRHTQKINWITVLKTKSLQRNLGSAEIIAFNKGLAVIKDISFDFLVKLDGDVRLEPDYFQQILTRMLLDPQWGIASGVYCENDGEYWVPVKMPSYHAAGASKVVRKKCYEQIGGFVAKKGWDTLDEIRAGLNGWKTGHFEDVQFYHLKREGAAMGNLGTQKFHGQIYYETGGGVLFFIVKAFHRLFFGKPFIIGGFLMIQGYLSLLITRKPRLVSNAEARYYRKMLNMRLFESLTHLLSGKNHR